MKKLSFEITYKDVWDIEIPENISVDDEDEALEALVYDKFLEYLNECVKYEDLTAFNFKKI